MRRPIRFQWVSSVDMPIRVRVKKHQVNYVAAMIERLRTSTRQILPHRVLSKGGRRLRNLIRFFAPVRTGGLRESIGYQWGQNFVAVTVSAPYTMYVEDGVRAHRIPKTGYKYMSFEKPSGELVLTKVVQHPGYSGRHFIQRAVTEFVRDMAQRFRTEVDAEIDVATH